MWSILLIRWQRVWNRTACTSDRPSFHCMRLAAKIAPTMKRATLRNGMVRLTQRLPAIYHCSRKARKDLFSRGSASALDSCGRYDIEATTLPVLRIHRICYKTGPAFAILPNAIPRDIRRPAKLRKCILLTLGTWTRSRDLTRQSRSGRV